MKLVSPALGKSTLEPIHIRKQSDVLLSRLGGV